MRENLLKKQQRGRYLPRGQKTLDSGYRVIPMSCTVTPWLSNLILSLCVVLLEIRDNLKLETADFDLHW